MGAGAGRAGVACLFPGQGTQRVGMGLELYKGSALARAVLDEVDEALGLPLTELMFQGPGEELVKTVNTQPAILAVSLACLKTWEASHDMVKDFQVDYVAGHSLGEYTALVAAGALGVSDAARLVQERGRWMQRASEERPGTMAASIGMDESRVAELCLEAGVQVSTINAEDQIVIAGHLEGIERAIELASSRGARRAVSLQVGGAFHSRLMEPAVEGMQEAISNVRFEEPKVPVIGNCTGLPLTTVAEIKEELIGQLCNSVQWRRSLVYLLGVGVGIFYEVGPGNVLSGLVRRLAPGVHVFNVSDLESAQRGVA